MIMRRTLLTLSLIIATSLAALAQQNLTFPNTEWDNAKAILMHTPGEELFDGVVHPYAGLFEYYTRLPRSIEDISRRSRKMASPYTPCVSYSTRCLSRSCASAHSRHSPTTYRI